MFRSKELGAVPTQESGLLSCPCCNTLFSDKLALPNLAVKYRIHHETHSHQPGWKRSSRKITRPCSPNKRQEGKIEVFDNQKSVMSSSTSSRARPSVCPSKDLEMSGGSNKKAARPTGEFAIPFSVCGSPYRDLTSYFYL